MKRSILLRASLSLVGVFAFTAVFCQDSTAVADTNSILGMAQHWPLGAKIVGILATISEILAVIPSKYLPANGILDGVVKFIKALNPKSPAATKVVLVILLTTACLFAKSQTLTSSLTNALPDSIKTWKGFRLTGPAAVYGYNSKSGNTLMTGVGLAYTWQHLTAASTWWVDESVGIMGYAGGSQAPTSLAMVSAIGPYVSFFNGYLSVGGAWNFTTGKPMLTLGAVLPLISN